MPETRPSSSFTTRQFAFLITVCVLGLGILAVIASRSGPEPAGTELKVETRPDDPVLAVLNGEPITQTQISIASSHYGAQLEGAAQKIGAKQVLERLIQQKLLSGLARELELETAPRVQARLQFAQEQILAEEAVSHYLNIAVAETELREFYDNERINRAGQIQMKARQIVLPDAATAVEILRRLDKGDAFASLALAFSIDRASRESGGDLGYINADMLDPLLSQKIFSAADGDLLDPFETAQGWHVVEVLSRRPVPVPSFEERREDILKLLKAQRLQSKLEELRNNANLVFPE